jgi:acyl-CoA thioester hydrolase
LHVDLNTKKVSAFPDDVLERLAMMKSAHRTLPRPSEIGRAIGMPPRN